METLNRKGPYLNITHTDTHMHTYTIYIQTHTQRHWDKITIHSFIMKIIKLR